MNTTTKSPKYKKRELPFVFVMAVLFLFGFFVAVIVISNYSEYVRATTEEEKVLIAIDPGHGGNDPGKVGSDNVLEKDINLQISLKLKTELEARGIEVIILREKDENLATQGATNRKTSDMKNRVQIINESGASLMISIHQNSFTDSSVRGPQVFYNGASDDSEEFAMLLQEYLKQLSPQYSREAKEGNGYYILKETVCPGVIVECGFLSCLEEKALLQNEEYQQKIASAIADAIESTYK